jgi:hypothetical protein
MEDLVSQGVAAFSRLNELVEKSGTLLSSVERNMGAVGFAARLHILGVAFQGLQMLGGLFKGLFTSIQNTEIQLVRIGTSLTGMGRAASGAYDVFAQAVDKAATTPYSLNEVLHTVTQLGGYGIAALDEVKDKQGKIIKDFRGMSVTMVDVLGNVAGATGKGLAQTMEAYADAIMGEWERMKELGIKPSMIPGLSALQAGTPQYKALVAEWLATSNRFAGGMFKQSQTIKGMMSNFGDAFTRFGLEVGGASNKYLSTQEDAVLGSSAKDIMGQIKGGKVSAKSVVSDYGVDKGANKDIFKGLVEGSTEYNRRLELAIKYSRKLQDEQITISKAGTFYDAIKISIRQLYNAFGDATSGIADLGTAVGQWLKHIWVTFIYPIFEGLANVIRWVGKVGESLTAGAKLQERIRQHTKNGMKQEQAEVLARQQMITERIGFMYSVFLVYFWQPFLNAMKAVGAFIGQLFGKFEEGVVGMTGKTSLFAALWDRIADIGKFVGGIFSVFADIISDIFSTVAGTGAFQNFFRLLGDIGVIIFDVFVGKLKVLFSFIGGFFSGLWEAVKPAVEYIGEAFSGLFKVFSEIIEGIFGNDAVKGFFDVLKDVFWFLGKVLGFIIGTVFKAIGFILGGIIKIITWLVEKIVEFFRWLGKLEIIQAIGKVFSWIGSVIKEYIIDPLGNFFSWLWLKFEELGNRFRNLRNHIPGADDRAVAGGTDFFEAVRSRTGNDLTTSWTNASIIGNDVRQAAGKEFYSAIDSSSLSAAEMRALETAVTTGNIDNKKWAEMISIMQQLKAGAEESSSTIELKLGSQKKKYKLNKKGKFIPI